MCDALLDKALKAIVDRAEQSQTFSDSCSITGDDYEACVFCCGSTQDARRRGDYRSPMVHEPDCVYLDAVRYLQAKG